MIPLEIPIIPLSPSDVTPNPTTGSSATDADTGIVATDVTLATVTVSSLPADWTSLKANFSGTFTSSVNAATIATYTFTLSEDSSETTLGTFDLSQDFTNGSPSITSSVSYQNTLTKATVANPAILRLRLTRISVAPAAAVNSSFSSSVYGAITSIS